MRVCRQACRAAAVVLAAALGGCVYSDGGVVRGGDGTVEMPISDAFISPPPGGPAIIAVLENRYRNGLSQDIILENNAANAGQNVIVVRAFGPMGRDAGSGTLDVDPIELPDIRRELARQFPGVRMEVSGLYAQNKYGPFGYATGHSRSGAACVYAWQRIASDARVFALQRGAVSWRLRVCDPGSDARSLLLLAYSLTINGYFLSKSWNPYGVPEPDPRIGAAGVAILPEQVVDPTVVPPTSYAESALTIEAPGSRASRRTASVRTTRVAARPSPAAPQRVILNRPVAGAAVVPRPEGTDLSEPVKANSNLPQTRSSTPPPRARGGTVPVPPAPQGFRATPGAASASGPGRAPFVRLVQPTNR